MDKISGLLEYLTSLIDNLRKQFFSLEKLDDIPLLIYEYMIDNSKDFSEFDKDYYNCQEYENIDKKDCLQSLMYATYFILKFYDGDEEDLYENIFLDDCSDREIKNNLDELFRMEEFGKEIVEDFLSYFDYPEVQRKKIALNLSKNDEFIGLFSNDNYVISLLANDISLEIPEVAILADDIAEIYDSINPDGIFDDENESSKNATYTDIQDDYEFLKKVKKTLLLKSLTKDCDIKISQNYMKHLFSIIIKSTYINIYDKKINNNGELSKSDYEFFDLINANEIKFDELFYKFMHDEKFAAYLISSFYIDNIDKYLIDFERDEKIYKTKKLDEKVKKYYI